MVATNYLTYWQWVVAFTETVAPYHVYVKGRVVVVLAAENISHFCLPKEMCLMAGTDVYTLNFEGLEHCESAMLTHSSPLCITQSLSSFILSSINPCRTLLSSYNLGASPLISSTLFCERRPSKYVPHSQTSFKLYTFPQF
jgi:hypothetical protein